MLPGRSDPGTFYGRYQMDKALDPAKLDCTVVQGAAGREKAYFEGHRAQGVSLRRKYSPQGQYVKKVKKAGGR